METTAQRIGSRTPMLVDCAHSKRTDPNRETRDIDTYEISVMLERRMMWIKYRGYNG